MHASVKGCQKRFLLMRSSSFSFSFSFRYLARHGIADEECLFDFLKNLTTGVDGTLCCLSDSAWELKALAVIGCINDMDVRVNATIELMRRAPVPPSQGLTALMEQVRASSTAELLVASSLLTPLSSLNPLPGPNLAA